MSLYSSLIVRKFTHTLEC